MKIRITTTIFFFAVLLSGNAFATQDDFFKIWNEGGLHVYNSFEYVGNCDEDEELDGVDYCGYYVMGPDAWKEWDNVDKMAAGISTPYAKKYSSFTVYYNAAYSTPNWVQVQYAGYWGDGERYHYWGREESDVNSEDYSGSYIPMMTIVYTLNGTTYQRVYGTGIIVV